MKADFSILDKKVSVYSLKLEGASLPKVRRRQYWRVGGPVAKWLSISIEGLGSFSIVDLSYGGVGLELKEGQNFDSVENETIPITLHLITADVIIDGKVRYKSKSRIGMSFQHTTVDGFKALKDTIGFFRAGMQSRFSPVQNQQGFQIFVGELPCYMKLKIGTDEETQKIEILNGLLTFMDIDGRFAKVNFDQILRRLSTERLSAAQSYERPMWDGDTQPLVFSEVNVHHFNADILKKAVFLLYGFAFGNSEYSDSINEICEQWVGKIYASFQSQKIGA